MHARVSVIAVWIVAALLAGGGAVAASSGYRHYAELARLKDAAEAKATSKETEMAELRQRTASLQAALAFQRAELRGAQRMLALTRALLQDTLKQADQVKETTAQLQQENAALRQCLAAALQALPLLSRGDGFQAVQVMMTVDTPCRVARQALYTPAATAGR
ncbi:MAG TPA: hypothetical protein VGK88_06810 [bacterium]|jgi:septal ring factor EnvC (AmiA/AmiB activator)